MSRDSRPPSPGRTRPGGRGCPGSGPHRGAQGAGRGGHPHRQGGRAPAWEASWARLCARGCPGSASSSGRARIDWPDIASLTLPRRGFLRMDRFEGLIRDTIGVEDFHDLAIPLSTVAVDLTTGRQVVFNLGPIARAVRASCSVPGVFEPVQEGEGVLVDGGLLNEVPADVVRAMGADVVLAVTLTADRRHDAPPRNVLDIIYYSFDLLLASRTQESLKAADIVVAPDLAGFALQGPAQDRRACPAGRRPRCGRPWTAQGVDREGRRGSARSVAPELVRGVQHGLDVFGRDLRLDVVHLGEHVAAARGEDSSLSFTCSRTSSGGRPPEDALRVAAASPEHDLPPNSASARRAPCRRPRSARGSGCRPRPR